METILILGNGLSRLAFDKEIRDFPGEVWGCNNIYLDYGDKVTAITGHDWCLIDAKREREKKGYKYRIFTGLKWDGGSGEESFTCAGKYRQDSGTALVAEALTRGCRVIACGFDMGGPDVYSPDHEKRNKTIWIKRWRLLFKEFSPDRVTFWGYDHKPFILSNRPADEYFREYSKGKAHLKDGSYQGILDNWTGNYSRIWERLPHVILKNVGRRAWTIAEFQFDEKGEAEIPESIAIKYRDRYPKEFKILPLPK